MYVHAVRDSVHKSEGGGARGTPPKSKSLCPPVRKHVIFLSLCDFWKVLSAGGGGGGKMSTAKGWNVGASVYKHGAFYCSYFSKIINKFELIL